MGGEGCCYLLVLSSLWNELEKRSMPCHLQWQMGIQLGIVAGLTQEMRSRVIIPHTWTSLII